MPERRVYLAGPIHHSPDHGRGWRKHIKNGYGHFCDWVDPMDQYDTVEQAREEWTDVDIVEGDLTMIDSCDAVLAHWETVPTAGTPMEIFYAKREAEIPVVVQTELDDIDISPWIEYHADAIVEEYREAVERLSTIVVLDAEITL